jgi:uncharacterized membrane protein HdeD (DUF308 family)
MKNANSIILLVSGIISLLFGVSVLFVTEQYVATLVRYIGLLILVAGVVLLIIAFTSKRKDSLINLQILLGISAVVMGGFIFFFTEKSISLFLVLFGIWSVVIGLSEIIFGIRFKLDPRHKNLLIINGVLTIALGIILFFNPFDQSVTIVKFIMAIIAIIVGVGGVYFGFILRRFNEEEQA